MHGVKFCWTCTLCVALVLQAVIIEAWAIISLF